MLTFKEISKKGELIVFVGTVEFKGLLVRLVPLKKCQLRGLINY